MSEEDIKPKGFNLYLTWDSCKKRWTLDCTCSREYFTILNASIKPGDTDSFVDLMQLITKRACVIFNSESDLHSGMADVVGFMDKEDF